MSSWDKFTAWIVTPILFATGLYGVIAGRVFVKHHGPQAKTLDGIPGRVAGVFLVGVAIYLALRLRREHKQRLRAASDNHKNA